MEQTTEEAEAQRQALRELELSSEHMIFAEYTHMMESKHLLARYFTASPSHHPHITLTSSSPHPHLTLTSPSPHPRLTAILILTGTARVIGTSAPV
jgi:hypothetical protein